MSNSASIAAAKKRRGGSSLQQTQPREHFSKGIPEPPKKYSLNEILFIYEKRLFSLEKHLESIKSNILERSNNTDDSSIQVEHKLEKNKILNSLLDYRREIDELQKQVNFLESSLQDSNQIITVLKGSVKTLTKELEVESHNNQQLSLSNNMEIEKLKIALNELLIEKEDRALQLESVNMPNEKDDLGDISGLESEEVFKELSEIKKESNNGRKKKGKEVSLNIKDK